MKNDVIDLVTIKAGQDADGFPINEETIYTCFADLQSVKGVEFYSAANVGIKVSLVAVVNYLDYVGSFIDSEKPSLVDVDGIRYRIVRTYKKRTTDDIELTLQEVE